MLKVYVLNVAIRTKIWSEYWHLFFLLNIQFAHFSRGLDLMTCVWNKGVLLSEELKKRQVYSFCMVLIEYICDNIVKTDIFNNFQTMLINFLTKFAYFLIT